MAVDTVPEALTLESLAAALAPIVGEVWQSLSTVLTGIVKAQQDILDSRIVCVACAFEHYKAETLGRPLPPLNTANVITPKDGGLCFGHVQFTDRPLAPNQTPSGLYLADRVA